MSDKTYFVKQETYCSYREDREEEHFVVIEAARLGQYYEKDVDGYECPEYCWTLREMKRCLSYEQALSYIEGVKSGSGGSEEASIRHPTITSSAGGPGRYPLDERGGQLLFTITSDAVARKRTGRAQYLVPDNEKS